MTKIIIFLAGMLLVIPPCFAQSDDEKFADAPLPPKLPEPLESGQTIEPEVYIVRTEKEVVEEYKVNGHLYMIKITPKIGKPYYLIDQNGDGQMEGKISDIYNTPRVPQWVLFSW
jgi:hypothetical protein